MSEPETERFDAIVIGSPYRHICATDSDYAWCRLCVYFGLARNHSTVVGMAVSRGVAN